jgi:casein kinase II subunit alpha
MSVPFLTLCRPFGWPPRLTLTASTDWPPSPPTTRHGPNATRRDAIRQLVKIAKVLGTDELFAYLDKYDLELDPQFDGILGRHSKKAWSKFVTPENRHLVSDEALDFVSKLLRYDHQERLTAQEAMAHPYFAPIRAQAQAAGAGGAAGAATTSEASSKSSASSSSSST